MRSLSCGERGGSDGVGYPAALPVSGAAGVRGDEAVASQVGSVDFAPDETFATRLRR
jgi:hypothetical protein